MTTPEPPNPYAPPAASLNAEDAGAPSADEIAELASRWQRLGGALFDGLLALVAMIPAFFGVSLAEFAGRNRTGSSPFFLFTETGTWGVVAGGLFGALTILQWTLLTKRGQTVGKILAGTRVVCLDDSRAGFLRAVVLRLWPGEIVSRIPLLQWLTLVDVLFIFGASRRCLHDRIAGTKVVTVRS